MLPEGYIPTVNDILCGRGKVCFEHCGNKQFHEVTVPQHLQGYIAAKSKLDKSVVVKAVVAQVRQYGDFIKQDQRTGRWFRVTTQLAREKVGQQLRDAVENTNPRSIMRLKQERVRNRAQRWAMLEKKASEEAASVSIQDKMLPSDIAGFMRSAVKNWFSGVSALPRELTKNELSHFLILPDFSKCEDDCEFTRIRTQMIWSRTQ